MADIHVLGAGAIGLSLANAFAYDHSVTLLVRRNYTAPFVFCDEQNRHCLPVDYINLSAPVQNKPLIKHCFVCVKSYQLNDAIQSIIPYLAEHANLFISHNGMSDLNEVKPYLGTTKALFFFSTSMGGLKIDDTTVKATGTGETYLGACNKVAQERLAVCFKQFFSSNIPYSKIHDNIEQLRWQKLLINVAINPLSAIHQIKNGRLRQPRFASAILELVNEACTIANADNVNIKLNEALTSAYQVMTRTQHNLSSMAQDVNNGRLTEIDAICGYIVKRGAHHNIETPYNREMLKLLLKPHR
jgi:2-dehydropantoate 2-reductase